MGSVVRRLARSLPVVGLIAALLAGCVPAPIRDQGYQLVFEDNFDTLDTTTWGTATFCCRYLPPTVADGVLTLQTSSPEWRGQTATTGPRRPSPEPNFPNARAWQEGYFEARIRFTDNPWVWPAFWLFSLAKSEAWPGEDCRFLTSEWDIMENGIPNDDGAHPAATTYFTALHRNTRNAGSDYCGQPDATRTAERDYPRATPEDPALAGWHVWAGRWTEDELCTYLDDVEIQCMEPYDTTAQPMQIEFALGYLQNCGGCPPRPSELEMQVDWVRVWQQP